MGKLCKVVVCGQAATGKTAILEQLIYNNHVVNSPTFSTIEDIYVANMLLDANKGVRECIHFFDTAGLDPGKPELPKQYLSLADGFVLVYDVTSPESFDCMDKLKKDIDKHKEKKEAQIISLGNKCDLKEQRKVDFHTANKWAQRENVRLWEVSVVNRHCLVEPFLWLATKINLPQSKSTFTTILGSGKRGKLSIGDQ